LVNGAIGAGKNHFAPVEKYTQEDFDKVMKVSVTGTFLCSRAAARAMARKGGSIINMGSIYGVVGADQRIYGDSGVNSAASYAASKGAILSLTRYLAVYGPKTISVSTPFPPEACTIIRPKNLSKITLSARRWGGWLSRKIWRAPWCFWPGRHRPMSPVKTWWWTAVGRRGEMPSNTP